MPTSYSPQTTSESHEDVLIVGAGQAAAELVKTLRTEGFQGSIRVLGAEGYLPYDRPPLSKGAMTNTLDMARLAFLNDSGYEKYGTAVDLGVDVLQIEADHKLAHTSDGRVINYGVCVIATGARAVPAPWPDIDRIHAIRTYEDALRLGESITNGAKRFLVVGGGYLGLETASSLSQSGLEVSLVEASPQLLTGRASKFVAEWLRKQHEANGVTIYLGSMVAELEQVDDEVRVRLANGSEITADQVVFAVGALANLDLAKAAGAECGRGVLVNDHCATTVADLYAIGDVASFRTKSGDEARIESVFNAKSQAKILARALAGKEPKQVGAPTFWSDQVGASIRLAGWVPPTIDTNDVVTQDETGWLVERYLGGRLVGIESLNRLPEYMRMLPEIMDLRKVL